MSTTRADRPLLWRRALPALAAAVALVAALGVAPASAHGGPGSIEVGEADDVGPLEIEFPIRVTYDNDGHDAEAIEDLRVESVDGDGVTVQEWVDPFTPGDAPGVFVVRLAFDAPGEHDLQITIAEPESSGSLLVSVSDPDEAPDEPGEAPDATVGTPDATAGADDPVEVDDTTTTTEAATAVSDDGDDGGSALMWVLIGAGLLIGVGIGVVAARKFRTELPQD